jgi:hypothetical protein
LAIAGVIKQKEEKAEAELLVVVLSRKSFEKKAPLKGVTMYLAI